MPPVDDACQTLHSQISLTRISLLTEAKFHYVVKRDPIRENSAAWSRVSSSSSVPEEMKSWVDAEVKTEAQASPVA